MSDNWIQIVPSDENFLPAMEAAERAAAALRRFTPQADEIRFRFSECVEFIDAGSNWEGVRCPECAADLEDWWPEKMAEAGERGFADLSCVTPCCGEATSLNTLHYPWRVAFGRFVLEAMNPKLGALTSAQTAEIESILGTKVKEIWQHI